MKLKKDPMQSNLECFIERTTPVVPSNILPKSEARKLNKLWNPSDEEEVEYFTLSDVWNSYDEWSVYGAGVPVSCTGSEPLVQYFAPHLSAIQIFTSNPSRMTGIREETSTFSMRRGSFSDSTSYESESEKLSKSDGGSSEDGALEQGTVCHPKDKLGYLYCQYFETIAPYGRVPLMDKISDLAQRYPGIISLRSVDLSPASWMAVAWYPIYHIPTGRNIRDLSACFLTYHTLSSSFQDADSLESGSEGAEKRKQQTKGETISLPPFGLATYKTQGGIWETDYGGRKHGRAASLLSVADSWLRQLNVQHHDFNHFVGFRGY